MGDKEAGWRHLRDGTRDSGGIQVLWSRRGEKDEGIDTAHRRGEGGIVQVRAITHGARRGEAVEEIDSGRGMRQVADCGRGEMHEWKEGNDNCTRICILEWEKVSDFRQDSMPTVTYMRFQ